MGKLIDKGAVPPDAPPTPAAILSDMLQSSLSKSPSLAEKQRRLLQKISDMTSQEGASTSSETTPAQAPTDEEQEEAASRHRWTVGRNSALAKQASQPGPPQPHDPVAAVMLQHPGLTREEAAKMAGDFGS